MKAFGKGWVLLVAVLGFGCSNSLNPSQKGQGTVTVRLASASDLQTVMPMLVESYKRTHPETTFVLTFGASGQLAEQIKAGAPFDLFLSANRAFVDDLAGSGDVVKESVAPYAIGSLVLAVHRRDGKEVRVKTLADLLSPHVKAVALANPDFAPYGKAAKQALTRAGLWEKLGPKLVFAESVRQSLQFVQTGNAEAGFVSLALAGGPEVGVVDVDPELYDPIVQYLGVVTRSPHRSEASAFARFLTEGEGRSILEGHGFGIPKAAGQP